eukprot:g292.t1
MKFGLLFVSLFTFVRLNEASGGPPPPYKDIHARIKSSADKLVHIGGKAKLELPIEVDVILIGFDGHGAYQYTLDDGKLTDLLQTNFDSFRPKSRETGEELATEYYIEYNVIEIGSTKSKRHGTENALSDLETKMKEEFVFAGLGKLPPSTYQETISQNHPDERVYALEATKLEPVLDQIVSKVLDDKDANGGAPAWSNRNAIVVMNPCKRRMMPSDINASQFDSIADFRLEDWNRLQFELASVEKEEGGFGYYWTYEQNGMSSTWLSRSNYVVIDVTAGPVKFGREMAPSGAVSPHSIPRIVEILAQGIAPLTAPNAKHDSDEFLEHVAEVRDHMFIGRISALVASALRHHFVNDVYIYNTMDSKNVVVPLIVLRNHQEFSPFIAEQGYFINGTSLQQELKGLVTGQRVMLIESVHSLHDHKALAVALYKSMTARSEALVHPQGEEQPSHTRLKYYIDGDVLLEEFRHASDVLAATLIHDDRYRSGQPLGPRATGPLDRTIPVFVLSLKNVPFDLTFQNEEFVVSNSEMVIVLQSVGVYEGADIGRKYTGHFVGGQPVIQSTIDVERHILSGVMIALTGSIPPYELFNAEKQEVNYNWLWATGHTPFGPYSTTKTLSGVTKQAAHRNALVGRLEGIIRRLQSLIHELDDFAIQHTSLIPRNDPQRDKTWMDYLYRQSESFEEPPIAKSIVEKLEKSMMKIEKEFVKLVDHFYGSDFHHAEEVLRSLGWKIGGITEEVHRELRLAREKLGCCELKYELKDQRSYFAIYAIVSVLVVAAMVAYVLIPSYEKDTGPLLAS